MPLPASSESLEFIFDYSIQFFFAFFLYRLDFDFVLVHFHAYGFLPQLQHSHYETNFFNIGPVYYSTLNTPECSSCHAVLRGAAMACLGCLCIETMWMGPCIVLL